MFIRRRRSAMYSNEKSNNDREIMSRGIVVRLTKKVRRLKIRTKSLRVGMLVMGSCSAFYVNYTAGFTATSCSVSFECVVTIRFQPVTILA